MNAAEILKAYFGYDSFKSGQQDVIDAILSNRDVIAIMPTGAGKSICYQIPAILLPGITIVVSPLISLMQDQVRALNEIGIHAGYINSTLKESQISTFYSMVMQGAYKILYVAPERLESFEFINFASRINISMVTVDEAHCISQWGQDFRPSYMKIVEFVKHLNYRPIISAFTATATQEVRNDILCILRLNNPKIVVTGFNRENLYFDVENVKKKDEYILNYLKKHQNDSGIIYCATRKNVDYLYQLLENEQISVTKYHAGMTSESRKKAQEDFIFDKYPVIIATNAFGMDIDKSNVRFVIHYNMPQSMENYYQEAGRAGRDGESSQCILLFSVHDVMINKFLLEHKDFFDISSEDVDLIKQRDIKRLQVMVGYCRTSKCLRNYILDYFGESRDLPCNDCGNCNHEFVEMDMTEDAKKMINCIYEAKGRYGQQVIIGTLIGANRARLKELGTIYYQSYGVLKHRNESDLRLLVEQLILDGYIKQSLDEYCVLQIGNIEPLRNPQTHVILRIHKNVELEAKVKKQIKRKKDVLAKHGYILFDVLRQLRLDIAREEAIPPYIVFSDKTLIDMCIKTPSDYISMLDVSGVGDVKFQKYGDRFINAIHLFKAKYPDCITNISDDDNLSIT